MKLNLAFFHIRNIIETSVYKSLDNGLWVANYILGILLVVKIRCWIKKQCREGRSPAVRNSHRAPRLPSTKLVKVLKNHGHELIDAALLNGADAAGRPSCSAHKNEA